jgi:hypothetical protein
MSEKRKESQRLRQLGMVFVAAVLPDHFERTFSSQADGMTTSSSFDFSDNNSEGSIKRSWPDRVLGFQQTGSFSRQLEQYNLMAGQSETNLLDWAYSLTNPVKTAADYRGFGSYSRASYRDGGR